MIGITLGVLLLIGAGIGAYYVLFHRDDTAAARNTDPAAVVRGFVTAYTSLAHTLSTADLTTVDGYLCPTDQAAMRTIYDHQKALHSADPSFSMRASDVAVSGAAGTFLITVTDQGSTTAPRQGRLVRQDGGWLVCDTVATPR